jgi:hypothetical protein
MPRSYVQDIPAVRFHLPHRLGDWEVIRFRVDLKFTEVSVAALGHANRSYVLPSSANIVKVQTAASKHIWYIVKGAKSRT